MDNELLQTFLRHTHLLGKKLGSGSNGTVMEAFDKVRKEKIAIKIEILPRRSLYQEKEVYDDLFSQDERPRGIAQPLGYKRIGSMNMMFLPKMRCTLTDLMRRKNWLSIRSVCNIGVQMLHRLEFIHSKGWLHLDVKPNNMMIGPDRGPELLVYLIDFGLAKRYLSETGRLMWKAYVRFGGTRTFSSVHVDKQIARSPRDDLESLMYSLLALNEGGLPWCDEDFHYGDPDVGTKESHKWLYREDLCRDMPLQFRQAWKIIINLEFEDKPDYKALRSLFTVASREEDIEDGCTFFNES